MPNASQLFKDDEDEQSYGRPSDDELRHITGIGKDEEAAMEQGATRGTSREDLAEQEHNPDSPAAGDSSAVQPGALAAAEGKPDSDRGNFKFTAIADTTPLGRALALLRRNKGKSAGFGGAAVVLAFIGIAGFGEIVSHELVTIQKDLIRYEAKAEQKTEKTAANRLLKKAFCRAIPASNGTARGAARCKSQGKSSNESEAEQTADDAEPLAKAIDSMDFTSPDNVAALEGQGIKVNVDAEGKFAGFTDTTTGDPVTADSLGSDSDLASRFETALPEWDVGQLQTLRPLMVEQAGASFDVVEGPQDDATKDVENSVLDKNGSPNLAEASAEDTEGTPDANATAEQTQTATDNSNLADTADGILDTANQDIAAGASEAQTISDTASKVGGKVGNTLLVSAVASMVCSVKKSADTASKSRVPTIQKLLIRHPTTMISLADQLKNGRLTGSQINQIMKLFNGNSAAPPNKDGTPSEDTLPFSSSAAWQRINGNPVSSANPEIEDAAKPTINAGTKVVQNIDKTATDTGLGAVCSVENSPFGFIANGLLGIGQLALDGFSLGTSQIAITGGLVALQETIQHELIPAIVKYFTPAGLDGLENSAQWMNNADAGANLMFNDYSRRLGGEPLTTSKARKLTAEATTSQNLAEARKSWYTRTFSFSDPVSLISRLSVELPMSRSQTLVGFADYFTNFPKTLAHNFSTIFSANKALADDPTDPGEPYGITQYGLTDKYDPITNEQYLNTPVTYKDSSLKRLQMLGDPNDYPNATPDSSTSDVLHCFTQDLSAASGNDSICGSEGSYDYEADNPNPITDTNIANVYCTALAGSPTSDCLNAIMPQLNDDIGHFRQYILDTHVMLDYTSLNTKS